MAEDSLFMIQDFQKTENSPNKPPQASFPANNASPQIKIQYQGPQVSSPKPSQKIQPEQILPSISTQQTATIK